MPRRALGTAAAQVGHAGNVGAETWSGGSKPSGSPNRTAEGVLIHQGDPYLSSTHLVWGSILWDSGLALAKYFAWLEGQGRGSLRGRSVLELGAGTGVLGLTLGKLGASVVLTDHEQQLLDLMRRNVELNGLAPHVSVEELNWASRSTYRLKARVEVIVAADVLYNRMDRMFMRCLLAHMEAQRGAVAYVASPPRADSLLAGFLGSALDAGLRVERLEDEAGAAVGSIESSAAYELSRFNMLSAEQCSSVAADRPDVVQIFRFSWP